MKPVGPTQTGSRVNFSAEGRVTRMGDNRSLAGGRLATAFVLGAQRWTTCLLDLASIL